LIIRVNSAFRRGTAKSTKVRTLGTDNGAAFVTGEVLRVDGGQHAGRW
jgi:hypothetical protein